MTPKEILAEAKSRFVVLYHKDEERLMRLLRQALGKYQDKAGLILQIWQEEPVFLLPLHFLAIVGCTDSKRRYLAHRFETIDGCNQIRCIPRSRHEAPYCLHYFCNLRDWDMDTDLPDKCATLICDYLEALIAVPNTKKEREAYLQAGMNESAQTLPGEQELRQRIGEIELEMESAKALIPPASSF